MLSIQSPAVSQYAESQVIEMTRQAAEKTDALLQEITAFLKPGVTEGQARDFALTVFKRHGVSQKWHNPYIYFGSNSILTFLDKPVEEKTLQEEDIAYIDIGPIVNGVEGDAGQTVVFGNNPLFHEMKQQSERIFQLAVTYWREKNPTGVELYEYIHKLTQEAGYVFHLNPAGHLIGSFPHKGWKDGLNTYPFTPEPGLWILEIQFRHPELAYGAFYEAVLL